MKKHRILSNSALALTAAAMLLFASCSKNKDAVSPEKITLDNTTSQTIANGDSATLSANGSQGKIYNVNSVYYVKKFRQSYSSGPGQPADGNFYWDFPNNDAGTSSAYSIKFSGIATGDITAAASTEIRFADIAFDDVVYADFASASTPASSPAGSGVIGMDQVDGSGVPPSVAAYANGAGWYIYHWTGHTVEPVADRTLFWKSGSTIYAFEISSIYEWGGIGGAFPYFHFRYRVL